MATLDSPVLIDANVCLDLLLQRRIFVGRAARIFNAVETGIFQGFVAAHAFDTLYYIISKNYSRQYSYRSLSTLRKLLSVAPVDETIIDSALNATWKDFEDCLHFFCAVSSGCGSIVTRNSSDFSEATIPVYTPAEFIEEYLL